MTLKRGKQQICNLSIGYRSYITIIKELSGTSAASEPDNCFIIVTYDLYDCFLLIFHDCTFENIRIDYFTGLLNALLNRYYKY